jgi:DNA repair protein RadD
VTLVLRPYQRESIDALYAYWQNGGGNALIVLPTAAGKSLVLATLCRELLADYPDLRIAIVTHVKELIAQDFSELMKIWPAAPAGIYSAGIGRRDARAKILFCGIQSVWNKTNILGAVDVLLIDEVHLVSPNSETTYGRFIEALRDETPDCRVVGLTATPFRLSSGRLDRGKDRLFDRIVYNANVADLIEQDYLSPVISKATAQKLDVRGVAKRGGEYIPGQLEIAVDKDWICKSAAQEMANFGADRRAWLAFCCGVKHAEHMRDAIRAIGVSCEMVTGETIKHERDRFISQFRSGNIRCLTSVGVLGTGFNVPHVDMIALLRPTQSAGLFVQQVGRGLRKAEGKENCLVLDFSGLTKLHGPIDQITSSGENNDKEKGEPLAKECPKCGTIVGLAIMLCPTCGHQWEKLVDDLPKHNATADADTSIISKGKPTWIEVDSVRYYMHQKVDSPPSLRAEYQSGFTVHKEWICLSHAGFPRQKAEEWWLRCGKSPIPRSTEEALTRLTELRSPSQIQVRPDGQFFRIVARRFEDHDTMMLPL